MYHTTGFSHKEILDLCILCYAKTRSQALTWRFVLLGRSPVFADQTAENLSAAQTSEGRSRSHDRRSVASLQQDHQLRLEH